MTPGTIDELTRRGSRSQPLAAVLLLLALAAVACGGSTAGTTSSDDPTPDAEAAAGQRLWIKHGDETQPFSNGDDVGLGALTAEIFVSPYPPGRTANIDFYVTRAGQPVTGANISLQYDMTVMEHGPFELLAVPTGGGHYLAPMDFVMDGDFWLNVSVDAGGEESVINMLVRAAR